MTKDLIEVADVDFRSVSIASIAAVFLIIAISFRSASIPVLLVAAIESAIMINMGIPYFTGTTLPFVASIVIGGVIAWMKTKSLEPGDSEVAHG